MDDILSLLNRRERQILVHSYIYYELDESIIDDATWTKWAFELCRLRDEHPDIFAKSTYAYEFKTFDGSTGFDLKWAYSNPKIVSTANYILKISKRKGNNNESRKPNKSPSGA